MHHNSNEKENHDFINNIKDEDFFFTEEYFNKDINLCTTNEKNNPSDNNFLNKKRIMKMILMILNNQTKSILNLAMII